MSAAQQLEVLHQGRDIRLERGLQLGADRRRGGHHHAQRVLVHAVDVELVVQVRAGGEAGCADKADGFARARASPVARTRVPCGAA